VGQYVFDNALMGLKAKGKTVVMVTHAVHLLDRVDYIYTMNNGQIAEQGTFDELMSKGQEGAFRRLIDEFGGMDAKSSEEEEVLETISTEVEGEPSRPAIKRQITEKMISTVSGSGKLEGRLMIPEGREVLIAIIRVSTVDLP
jgi:ATP-binding cassette subfamily C (CFTR/MRP) protein 1